jgi:hypothetical protein
MPADTNDSTTVRCPQYRGFIEGYRPKIIVGVCGYPDRELKIALTLVGAVLMQCKGVYTRVPKPSFVAVNCLGNPEPQGICIQSKAGVRFPRN